MVLSYKKLYKRQRRKQRRLITQLNQYHRGKFLLSSRCWVKPNWFGSLGDGLFSRLYIQYRNVCRALKLLINTKSLRRRIVSGFSKRIGSDNPVTVTYRLVITGRRRAVFFSLVNKFGRSILTFSRGMLRRRVGRGFAIKRRFPFKTLLARIGRQSYRQRRRARGVLLKSRRQKISNRRRLAEKRKRLLRQQSRGRSARKGRKNKKGAASNEVTGSKAKKSNVSSSTNKKRRGRFFDFYQVKALLYLLFGVGRLTKEGCGFRVIVVARGRSLQFRAVKWLVKQLVVNTRCTSYNLVTGRESKPYRRRRYYRR